MTATPTTPPPVTPSRVPLYLIALAAPVIASMISRTVMSWIDFIMVSSLGPEAQAAILPSGIFLFTFIGTGMGLVSSVNTFVSQSLGRGRGEDCASYGWQGVYLSLFVGVVVMPLWFVIEPMFALAGHEPTVVAMETAYARIGLWGVGPAIAAMALSNFFTGVHKPSVGLWSAVIANVLNIVGNYLLIFGNHGFPQMGMAGAALSTTIAAFVHMFILIGWMLLPSYRARYNTAHQWQISLRRIRQLIRVGLPAAGQLAVDIGSWGLFTVVLVGRFGTEALAASNVAHKFLEVSFMPVFGLGTALTAAVGHAMGSRNIDLARRLIRWALAMAMTYMGGMALVMVVWRYELESLLTNEAAVIAWAGPILIFCGIFQLCDALNITLVFGLRGAGDTFVPAVVQVTLAAVVLLVGGAIVITYLPQLNVLGPWLVATVYIALLAVAFSLRYRLGAWQRIDLFGND